MPPEAALEAEDDAAEFDAEEVEAAEDQDPAADEAEGEGEEEPAPKRKPRDPEAELHNLKGQNARERSRRRAAEARARDVEERLARVESSRGGKDTDADELLEIIGSLRDDEEDPVGDIAAVKKALKAFRARQLADVEQTGRQKALEQQFQKLNDAMRESEADFVQDFPDYNDAAAFYRKQRVEELEDAGYSGAALQRKLADDLYGVVRMAIDSGHDPAERVYALAKRRGFKANASAADKKVDVLRRAAEAGRKPGSGTAGTRQVMSWADVAKLDGPARDKAYAQLRERERRAR